MNHSTAAHRQHGSAMARLKADLETQSTPMSRFADELAARSRARTVVVSSRYRCRDHPDEPVTARGAGCPECATT